MQLCLNQLAHNLSMSELNYDCSLKGSNYI